MVDFLNADMTQTQTIVTTSEIAWHYCKAIFTIFCVAVGIFGACFYIYKLAVRE